MPTDKAEYHRQWAERNRERLRQYQRDYRARNREHINADKRRRRAQDKAPIREWHLKNRYGITVEQYLEILDKQGGVCAICGNPPKQRNLHVDHDHASGRVRGLLCTSCNPRLYALENVEWRSAAEAYLDGAQQA